MVVDPDGGGGLGVPGGVSSNSVTQYSAAGCVAIDPPIALGAVGICCVHDVIVTAAIARATIGAINRGDVNDISALLPLLFRPLLSQKVNHEIRPVTGRQPPGRPHFVAATGSCEKVRGGFGKPSRPAAELAAYRTMNESSHTQDPFALSFRVPVASMVRVCVPAARPSMVYGTARDCEGERYVSTVALSSPST